MKKLYFLIGLCLLNLSSFATFVTVNSTGATGSYKTGYTRAASLRTDGDMVIVSPTTTQQRGYAVFDLAGVVPAGAVVTGASLRFNFVTTTGGLGVACGIYGFAGDLSTVTTPSTLFADCFSGAAFNTANWGASTTGTQDLLVLNPTGRSFIQANAGMIISIGFTTTGGANIYTITGEGGTAATQPQLQITYTCTGVTGVSATATPNPVCNGSTLHLNGAATGAATYSWSGPGGFTATTMNATLTSSPAAAGIYTFTAFSSGGCNTTATTSTVGISAPVPGITGTPSVCAGSTTTLSDPASGTWSSSATTIATVVPATGVVRGLIPGTATIILTTAAGCDVSTIVTVNPVPAPITGASSVCVGSTIFLSDPSSPGTWSSSNTTQATVNTFSGAVLGLSSGAPNIVFTSGGCTATMVVSVNPAPAAITGTLSACPGSTTTLSDAAAGGVWTSSNTGVATIGSGSGVVTGGISGTTLITYANGCGPAASATVVINPLPADIHGQNVICLGSTDTLTDTTPFGTWSAAPGTIATVGSASGVVTGVGLGTAVISYTLATSCAATFTVTVNAPPTAISGPGSVCTGHTITLSETSTGGTWSSSNTSMATVSATGVVRGISFGTVGITYTSGPSCFLVRTITVNPEAAIVGTDSVCLGLSAYLTNIVGGGAWSSSNFSVATIVPDSGRITGVATGTTTVIYLLPTGCQTSKVVRVIAFPDAISGTTQACPGTSTTLADARTGGVWSSSNIGIATVGATTGIVSGIIADTVTIGYTIRPGCMVTKIVTINPLPAPITGATPVCPQVIDSLSDATPGGTWSSNTPTLATVIDTSGVVTTIGVGSAIIKYTLPTGCFRTKIVSINPLPVPTVTYDWLTTTLYTPDVYVNYQWYDSITGPIPHATSPSVAALYTEYYFVVVTDTNGCRGASVRFPFNVSELGTKNTAAKNNIKIYPNPVSGDLYIQSLVKVRAVISGIDGKEEMIKDDATVIDVSQLPGALYLLTIYDEQGHVLTTQKLIKQ